MKAKEFIAHFSKFFYILFCVCVIVKHLRHFNEMGLVLGTKENVCHSLLFTLFLLVFYTPDRRFNRCL